MSLLSLQKEVRQLSAQVAANALEIEKLQEQLKDALTATEAAPAHDPAEGLTVPKFPKALRDIGLSPPANADAEDAP